MTGGGEIILAAMFVIAAGIMKLVTMALDCCFRCCVQNEYVAI